MMICPEHGKADMIAFSSDAMWHPSTGESRPAPHMFYICRRIIRVRRFLFWRWDVYCSSYYVVEG